MVPKYITIKFLYFFLCLFMPLSVLPDTYLAIMPLTSSGVSMQEAYILTERLRVELFNIGKYTIVEREMIEEILKEQNFQLSGCTSNECLVEVGQLLGVQQILGGSVGKIGQTFTVNVRLIDVETGQILEAKSYDYQGEIDGLLSTGIPNVARQLSGLSDNVQHNTKSNANRTLSTEYIKLNYPLLYNISQHMYLFPKLGYGMRNDYYLAPVDPRFHHEESVKLFGGISYGWSVGISNDYGVVFFEYLNIATSKTNDADDLISGNYRLLGYEHTKNRYAFQVGFGVFSGASGVKIGIGYKIYLLGNILFKPVLEGYMSSNPYSAASISLNFGYQVK